METTNIFDNKPDEEKTNLSAPLEGEFVNPQADADEATEKLTGDLHLSNDDDIVGTDGELNDDDSSLTTDTDKPVDSVTDLPPEADGHDKP